MKLLLLLLLLPSPLHAFIWEPDYTGLKSEKFDYGFYIGHSAPEHIGGPAANNSSGGAWQFVVSSPVRLSYLNVSGQGYSQYRENTDLDVYFKIYNKTRISEVWGTGPDMNSLLISSNPWHVEVIGDYQGSHTNLDPQTLDFDVEIPNGTYWFAQERRFEDSGPIISPEVEFHTLDTQEMHIVHTPEPATFALFGLGGLALLRRFKR